MAIDLAKILANYEKKYDFVVKLACEKAVSEEKMKTLDIILKLKGMIARTTPERLPIQAQPLEFRRLEGFVGYIYVFNISFKYPITASELTNEICSDLEIGRAFISVRTSADPVEIEEEDYLKYKDEDYANELLNNDFGIDVDEYMGNKFKDNLVKALDDSKAREENQKFKEVDVSKLKG